MKTYVLLHFEHNMTSQSLSNFCIKLRAAGENMLVFTLYNGCFVFIAFWLTESQLMLSHVIYTINLQGFVGLASTALEIIRGSLKTLPDLPMVKEA